MDTADKGSWAQLGPLLSRRGIDRIALVGAGPETARAFQESARRRGFRCQVVDGLRHHSGRRSRDVGDWADVVVVCVSGLIAHRVSQPYRRLETNAVATVRARSADGIARELALWAASPAAKAA